MAKLTSRRQNHLFNYIFLIIWYKYGYKQSKDEKYNTQPNYITKWDEAVDDIIEKWKKWVK